MTERVLAWADRPGVPFPGRRNTRPPGSGIRSCKPVTCGGAVNSGSARRCPVGGPASGAANTFRTRLNSLGVRHVQGLLVSSPGKRFPVIGCSRFLTEK